MWHKIKEHCFMKVNFADDVEDEDDEAVR